jgi:urease accessory protein
VRVAFRQRAGATRLATLLSGRLRQGALPTPLPGQPPEPILINTAGGLTGGDRFAVEIDIQAGASATITSQACERVYRSTGDDARVTTRCACSGGRLAWLPQETILFDGGQLSRSLEVDLEGDAEFLGVEAILFGRAAMGERVNAGALHDRWRVRRDGRLIFADDFRVGGRDCRPAHSTRFARQLQRHSDGAALCAEPERLLDPARAIIGGDGGASAWGGKLLVRLATPTGLHCAAGWSLYCACCMAANHCPKSGICRNFA